LLIATGREGGERGREREGGRKEDVKLEQCCH